MPLGTEQDTKHRMKRKLGNIDRADDATSRLLAKRISSTVGTRTKRHRFVKKKDRQKQQETPLVTAQPLQLQKVVLSWALARRLDPHFFEQAIEHLQWYAGTLESAHVCIEKVKLDAVETFVRKNKTLGIPGVHPAVLKSVGPSSSLHQDERSRELYEEMFEHNVSRPWIALVASLLSPSSLLHYLMGKKLSLSVVFEKMRQVEGFGSLLGGDLVQDLLGPAGLFLEKPCVMFSDHGTASYAGPGAGRGCNFIFRKCCSTDPPVRQQDQERQWILEQRSLLRKWTEWGMSDIKLGSRGRKLDLLMIEFSLCDYQRAVR